MLYVFLVYFFQAEDGIRDDLVTGVQTCALPIFAEAQGRRITGVVTAEGTNEPVSNATVSVVGTTVGTYTAEDGRFVVNAPTSGALSLRVRRIGYQAKTGPVATTQNTVNDSLARDV